MTSDDIRPTYKRIGKEIDAVLQAIFRTLEATCFASAVLFTLSLTRDSYTIAAMPSGTTKALHVGT
jgi:ADP-ribosylglycohydrolase